MKLRALFMSILLVIGSAASASMPVIRSTRFHAENAKEADAFLRSLNIFGNNQFQGHPASDNGPDYADDAPKGRMYKEWEAEAKDFLFAVFPITFDQFEKPKLAVDSFGNLSEADSYGIEFDGNEENEDDPSQYGYYEITMTNPLTNLSETKQYHVIEFDVAKKHIHLEAPGGYRYEDRTQISIWVKEVEGDEKLFISTYEYPHYGFASRVSLAEFKSEKANQSESDTSMSGAEIAALKPLQTDSKVLAQSKDRRIEKRSDGVLALINKITNTKITDITYPAGFDIKVEFQGATFTIDFVTLSSRFVYLKSDGRYLFKQTTHNSMSCNDALTKNSN